MKSYDFIAIGGGSAGFNAARVAVALGLRTAIIDGARELGGLCILRGCMPSKTLLYSAEVLHLAQKGAIFGLKTRGQVDMKAVHARKLKIIGEFAEYRLKALESGKFDLIRSHARFVGPHTVELSTGERIRSRHFLIGTGSKVSTPAVPGLREAPFWTSDDILDLDFVPKSVIVLGGGIVACELAQFLNRIGSRVTQVQRSSHILRDHSPEAAVVVEQALRDEGIELFTATQLQQVKHAAGRGFTIEFMHEGKVVRRQAERLFNALGREPNVAGLDLGAAGVAARPNGQIITDQWQQTSQPHIYAAGDCAGPVEIVHIAIQQGELAARHAAGVGDLKPVDYSLLLNVVFTDPQLATIGRSERELEQERTPFLKASYPFNDHGKSILMDANYGHVKVLAAPKSGRLLGAEIVGKDAGELIHSFSGPLAMRATVFDLLRAPWYHPTLAEIITYPLEEIADTIGAAPVKVAPKRRRRHPGRRA
ncbi:NAD(P)/FAD-dependent oxidoreductase [Opitutus sp. ER46]|uniref:dihydrolipoyl dehydrogenase family protein n=1 Tax=Opitutus sp. ER46 TaxID=2161864 RepID=UPI000D31EAE8|nr:NAD(P)/FAD-dependent oxidoreductase [Opitutus sp. ER46]PTX91086.1 pyridine nucleotide-disulfide oxidoreductase [Opitutus sp. ER46]